ncbi:MAG: Adaptor for signal transduction [Chaenotheca gracillima]|nr:MAG: Adaptor for signal transduction [Chaenotheca gracillima]
MPCAGPRKRTSHTVTAGSVRVLLASNTSSKTTDADLLKAARSLLCQRWHQGLAEDVVYYWRELKPGQSEGVHQSEIQNQDPDAKGSVVPNMDLVWAVLDDLEKILSKGSFEVSVDDIKRLRERLARVHGRPQSHIGHQQRPSACLKTEVKAEIEPETQEAFLSDIPSIGKASFPRTHFRPLNRPVTRAPKPSSLRDEPEPAYKPYRVKLRTRGATDRDLCRIAQDTLKKSELEPGFVYIYKRADLPGLVKIGLTNRDNVQTRLDEMSRTCQQTIFEIVDVHQRRVRHARRVERLVHAELALWQMTLALCEACGRRHKEWFEIEEAVALSVVERWRAWVEMGVYATENEGPEARAKDGIGANKFELDPEWTSRLCGLLRSKRVADESPSGKHWQQWMDEERMQRGLLKHEQTSTHQSLPRARYRTTYIDKGPTRHTIPVPAA